MDGGLRMVVLIAHIASGGAGLLLAAAVLAAGRRQDWTARPGLAYVASVCAVALTAVVLVTTGSTLPQAVRWLLGVVAVATAAAAIRGLSLGGAPDRRPAHLRLMWGSVTSLVAAVAVVSAPAPVWIAVVVAGTALTEYGYRRARRDPVDNP
jgi:glucan phosphoethanolaminetransferase (alkaline phosphatase superfamily)